MSPTYLLFVCTANLCRSPVAAGLASAALVDAPAVAVDSAGTRAVDGRPLPDETFAVAERLGVTVPPTSRALTVGATRRADLILCMTRNQRREVVRLDRAANTKVFTLLEFARVVDAVAAHRAREGSTAPRGDDELHAFLADAVRLRGLAPRARNDSEDAVTDPFPDPRRLFPQTLAEMTPAVEHITDRLAHASSSSASAVG